MYLSVMKQPRMKVWLLSLIQMPLSSLLPLSPTTHLLNRLPFTEVSGGQKQHEKNNSL